MKKIVCFLALLPSCVYAQPQQIEYRVKADLYSQPISIHSFLDDWKDPNLKSGNNAFAHGKMQLGLQQGSWNYAWVWRYDYVLNFSQDMAKLYHQIQNDQLIDSNQHYNLDLKAQHIDAVGTRFAYDWSINADWILSSGLTALIGRHYVDGYFQGTGQTTQMQELFDRVEWLNGSLNYSYDRPALKEENMGWDPQANRGYGYALDFALSGRMFDRIDINLSAEDLVGYLYWDNAPYTQYELRYDQDNRPRFDIRGQLGTKQKYTQRLPCTISTEINYAPEASLWKAGISTLSNEYITLYQLNGYYRFELGTLGIHFEPQSHAYGVSFQHQNIGLKYLTDDLNTNQAHRMGALVYAQYQW
ncbi:hypothetical protein [Acinetobacter ihumii]|uniref:hypothetical protein n=1 Tax=Acinetobacter ihumii TaxID=2483802 RepID=UPI001D195FB2|nr:hypothetical protein [Acinetobacter ihumii]